jgi:hypothetical protein
VDRSFRQSRRLGHQQGRPAGAGGSGHSRHAIGGNACCVFFRTGIDACHNAGSNDADNNDASSNNAGRKFGDGLRERGRRC